MMASKKIIYFLIAAFIVFVGVTTSSCGAYSFTGASVPDSIKTIRVQFIDNRARYVNPQLSPRLTDRVKQKINNKTRLTQTNDETNAHYIIAAVITDYSVSTSAISEKQAVSNRLTVGVHITVTNQLANKKDEYDVSRSFEFGGNETFEAAQASLMDDIIRDLSDDIFNRVFSNW
jgi:hypothetical protein